MRHVGWGEPQAPRLHRDTGPGPNSAGAEFSSFARDGPTEGTFLYFSSTVSGNLDIYGSTRVRNGQLRSAARR